MDYTDEEVASFTQPPLILSPSQLSSKNVSSTSYTNSIFKSVSSTSAVAENSTATSSNVGTISNPTSQIQ